MLKTCSIRDCDGKSYCRGWCAMHYMRWKTHGDPEFVKFKRAKNGVPMQWVIGHVKFDGRDCLIWPFGGRVDPERRPYIDGKRVSRIMCELVNGPPPLGATDAAHNCGNGKDWCVHPRHLRWATKLENEADKIIHGTLPVGEWHPNAVLTSSQVLEIRALRGIELGSVLAKRFGVAISTISSIHTGRLWKHLRGERQ